MVFSYFCVRITGNWQICEVLNLLLQMVLELFLIPQQNFHFCLQFFAGFFQFFQLLVDDFRRSLIHEATLQITLQVAVHVGVQVTLQAAFKATFQAALQQIRVTAKPSNKLISGGKFFLLTDIQV